MVDPIHRLAAGAGLGPGGRGTAPRQGRAWRLAAVGAALVALYAANFEAIRTVAGPDGRGLFRYYPLFFGLLFVLYLAGVWLTWGGGRRVALAVIASGMVFRLLMLPTGAVLSSDPYRYLWDGRVQMAGINPFRYAPGDEALAPLRDPEIHPQINRPTERTIYPPGAQLLFLGLAGLAPDRIWALRLLLGVCELATLLLLLRLLTRLGIPEGRVTAYAWAPLPVFEIAQAAHIDGAFLPLVLGAVLARTAARPGLAGVLLGGAALIKLYPAILLPALWQRRAWRLPLGFLGVVALGYLPYAWGLGGKVLGFLPAYFQRSEDFNVGLRALLTEGIGLRGEAARVVVMGLLAAVLVAALVAIGRSRPETPMGYARAAGLSVGTYLLLVPASLHPWYVVWLIPFLPILAGAGWWWLSGAVAVSYLAYASEPSQVPVWARCLEWLPAYALILGALWAPARRRRRAATAVVGPRLPSASP